MSLRTRPVLVAAMAAVFVPSTTFADLLGSQGTIDSLTVYESTSDDYAMNNGILVLKEEGGAKTTYKWGGSWCPNRTLSASSVALLFDAQRSAVDIAVIPSYKTGNAGTKCLTVLKFKTLERTP